MPPAGWSHRNPGPFPGRNGPSRPARRRPTRATRWSGPARRWSREPPRSETPEGHSPVVTVGASRAGEPDRVNRPLAVSAVLAVASIVGAQIGAVLGLRRRPAVSRAAPATSRRPVLFASCPSADTVRTDAPRVGTYAFVMRGSRRSRHAGHGLPLLPQIQQVGNPGQGSRASRRPSTIRVGSTCWSFAEGPCTTSPPLSRKVLPCHGHTTHACPSTSRTSPSPSGPL